MKLKTLLWFTAGIVLYVLTTLAVLRFFPDDPAQMTWQDREAFNAKVIQHLASQKGVNQEYLFSRLGSPDITEAYQADGTVYQLMYYRTHRKAADGITTADECTAILFIDRQLSAIGENALAQYRERQPHARSVN